VYSPLINDFVREPDDALVIWRFMRLPSFLSLLQTTKLFFIRLSKVNDPYECEVPDWAFEKLARSRPLTLDDTLTTRIRELFRLFRATQCVCCWHKGPVESAAMWSLYSDNSGLAVRTTVGRLKSALRSCTEAVSIGEVLYEDFADGSLVEMIDNPGNLEWIPYFKRNSFEHEREIRAFVHDKNDSDGISLTVDLSDLVESVFLSPHSEPWVQDVIQTELNDHGLPHVKVVRSSLYQMK